MGDFIKILFSILLPPLGVFFAQGLRKHFWINIVLTLLGYLPGVIHAVYIISRERARHRSIEASQHYEAIEASRRRREALEASRRRREPLEAR